MNVETMRLNSYWHGVLSNSAQQYRTEIEKSNEALNAFISFENEVSLQGLQSQRAQSVLAGVPFAIKENISHSGRPLTCASRLLENFISPITATAVSQLLEAGAVPVGRTNMDEFGMGSDTTNSIYGRTNNPWDVERTAGGSSGGSAAAVAGGMVPFALGSDTGGSIRQPASFCGTWGLKPTYGAVSRYGLVAFASSLDVIGIVAESIAWIRAAFSAIKVRGRDARDASSFYPKACALPSVEVRRVAVYKPKSGELEGEVGHALEKVQSQYEKLGYEVSSIDLPFLEYSPAVYTNISNAEASANLARFDGVRYGERGAFAENNFELIRNARSGGFGREVTFRIITGCFALRSGFQDECYIKAQNIREQMRKRLQHIFTKVDVLVLPTFPRPAFRFDDASMDPFQQKLGDAYSVVANLVGVPALNMPVSFETSMPVGVQVVAPHYAEDRLFAFAEKTCVDFVHEYSPCARALFETMGSIEKNQKRRYGNEQACL